MQFGAEDSAHLDRKSAAYYQEAIKCYRKEMDRWFHRCDQIDRVYSGLQSLSGITLTELAVVDREYDLFWASMEVIKPSIYSRPPVPVVTTKFKDRSPVKRVTAELLERAAISGFEFTDINSSMLGVRDDLAINARGQLWVLYEDDGEEKVCIDHIDRDDFAHDPVRNWKEVGWVARRGWLTKKEMHERFGEEAAALATYTEKRKDKDTGYGSSADGVKDTVPKAAVWEFWDKTEEKVVWFCEDSPDILDKDDPHLKLQGFFPCPEPAYGTRQRRSLVPVPDMVYVQGQLETINLLTQRIHDLAEHLRVVGLIPGGNDIGDAVETAMRSTDNSSIVIPVPSAAFGNMTKLVEWLPIEQVAQTILAAVEERRELIGNVQELLGVADIQRGDSDPNETLGAQQIKVQHTSTRSRDRVKGLERIARDAGRIMVEIFAEEFSFDTLLKMAQMELPTNAEVQRELKEIQEQAEKQVTAIEEQAMQAAQQNPEAAQQAQGQIQQIIQEASQRVAKVSQTVTIEQVKELLNDTKTDPFIFDIETDSTIYPDEMAEKQMRNEFMSALANGVQALMPMVQSGGAQAAGEILKWNLDVYRPPRQLMSSIDEWVDALAEMPPQNGDGGVAELAAAEMEKAKAQMAKVEADSQYKQAELQQRMTKMQGEFQEKAAKLQLDNQKLQLQGSKQQQEFAAKMADMDAKQNLMQAQTAEILNKIGLDIRKQDLEEYRAATETQFRAEDQARADEGQAFDQAERVENSNRADRGEDRADRGQEFSERQGERQQALAERTAGQKNER